MIKTKFFLCLFLVLPVLGHAQEKKVDSVAVFLLDHMSQVIGELESCSYRLSSSVDVEAAEIAFERQFNESEVFMQGPDKMLVHSVGHHGHRGFYYDGALFTYYSFHENNYTTVEAPDNIVAMIDTINYQYGVEFPAADFFYPTFTDDILADFDKVLYLGTKVVDGKDCFHIAASNEQMTVQIWIANDAMNLPQKFLITKKDKVPYVHYEATFEDWKLNPSLPASIFTFVPPPGARLIAILPKPH